MLSFFSSPNPDLAVDLGDFSSTTATVSAVTPRGREFLAEMFGRGAVSFELPKSNAIAFEEFAASKGIAV